MRESALKYFVCPKCKADLRIESAEKRVDERIKTGKLACTKCGTTYPIISFIPRFVPVQNYALNFGYQWSKHSRTQYDSYTGLKVSEKRFFEETGWSRDLSGQMMLEAGSGSGRYTEQAASTNATVISFDYSNAVEANYASNGLKDNVVIAQADIYSMPLREAYFDKVFCFGVLQHTPDVRKSFLSLAPMLKPGGELVVDIYRRTKFHTKYVVRPFTTRIFRTMPPSKAYELTKRWVDLMWPLSERISKMPKYGPKINWLLFVPDYSKQGVQGDLMKEWAYLDVFDMLAPSFDSPQTIKTLSDWFAEAKLSNVAVKYGYNGIEGRGKKSN